MTKKMKFFQRDTVAVLLMENMLEHTILFRRKTTPLA